MQEKWAEEIPKEVLLKVLEFGRGHDVIPAEHLIELGLNKEIVDKFSKIHKSVKRPGWDAVTNGAEILKDSLTEWAGGDKVNFCVDDAPWEKITENMFDELIKKDIHEISAYSHKETIYVDGEVVESLEGVYDLELVRCIAGNLDLKYDAKIGRGFQYRAICKSIYEYVETKDVQ